MPEKSIVRPSSRLIGASFGTALLSIATTLLSNFFLVGAVAAEVDKETFGVYSFVSQLSLLFGLLLLGFDAAVGVKVAAALSTGDVVSAGRVADQLRFMCSSAAAVCIVFTIVSCGAVWWYHAANPRVAGLWVSLLLLTGLAQTIGLLTRASIAVLVGSQFQYVSNLVRIVQQLAAVGIGYGIFVAGAGVACLPAAELVTAAGGWFALRRIVGRMFPWALVRSRDRWKGFRSVLVHGLLISFTGVASTVESAVDPIILEGCLDDGLRSVGTYALWGRLPALGYAMCMSYTVVMYPALVVAFTTDPDRGRGFVGKVLVGESVLTALLAAGFGWWLTPVVHHWWFAGRYDLPDGPLLASLFGLWVACRSRITVMQMTMNTTGRDRFGLCAMWVMVVVKIIAAIFLTRALGIEGLVIASVLAYAGMSLVVSATLWRAGIFPWWGIVGTAVPMIVSAGAFELGKICAHLTLTETVVGILATAAVFSLIGGTVLFAAGLIRFRPRVPVRI